MKHRGFQSAALAMLITTTATTAGHQKGDATTISGEKASAKIYSNSFFVADRMGGISEHEVHGFATSLSC
jgi:hypothetical protein